MIDCCHQILTFCVASAFGQFFIFMCVRKAIDGLINTSWRNFFFKLKFFILEDLLFLLKLFQLILSILFFEVEYFSYYLGFPLILFNIFTFLRLRR